MAKQTQTCGKTTVTYDDRCGYSCVYDPKKGYHWYVECPDGQGGTTITDGTGHTTTPPRHPSVTIAGELAACARILERVWKRPVIVPAGLRGRILRRRTLRGTPEEIAHALGLEVGSRRRA